MVFCGGFGNMMQLDMDRFQLRYLVGVYLESQGSFLFQLNGHFTARSVNVHGQKFVSS